LVWRSISRVEAPSCAAPAATESPPDPAPMTQISTSKYMPLMTASPWCGTTNGGTVCRRRGPTPERRARLWTGGRAAAAARSRPECRRCPENWVLPIPATFIVGTDGIVTARFVDPDYRMRMAIEDMGDLHPARALGCGSRCRHTAYRRPLFGAGIGNRDGPGIDHPGRDTEDRATRLDVRMAVRTVTEVSPPLWKLYSRRIGKLRPALR
jgi:hypothetical protein